jgi:hypothetical protein
MKARVVAIRARVNWFWLTRGYYGIPLYIGEKSKVLGVRASAGSIRSPNLRL